MEPGAPRRRADLERAGDDHGPVARLGVGPAQLHEQAGQEFGEPERFGDVVDGTGVESDHNVDLLLPGGH